MILRVRAPCEAIRLAGDLIQNPLDQCYLFTSLSTISPIRTRLTRRRRVLKKLYLIQLLTTYSLRADTCPESTWSPTWNHFLGLESSQCLEKLCILVIFLHIVWYLRFYYFVKKNIHVLTRIKWWNIRIRISGRKLAKSFKFVLIGHLNSTSLHTA